MGEDDRGCADLAGGLFGVEHWDPLLGGVTPANGLSAFPSAAAVVLLLLATTDGWVPAAAMSRSSITGNPHDSEHTLNRSA